MALTPEADKSLEQISDIPVGGSVAQTSPSKPCGLEENAAKIAALEQERLGLGPLRRISFITRFHKEEIAQHFANVLNLTDWRIEVIHDGSECYVKATKAMEPIAENVTAWEEYFRSHLPVSSDFILDRGHFKGWEYCDKKDLSFSSGKYFNYDTPGSGRADVLFGMGLAQDRLSGHKWNKWPATRAPAFKVKPRQFIDNALARRPFDPQPTASGFSQWIYSLYAKAHGSDEDREDGKEAEQAIFDARRLAYGSIDSDYVRREFPDWALVHNGLHLQDEQTFGYFDIPGLPVAGQSLRALPDLIFRHARTGEVIIVEIKHSRMAIPENLWPNIWGQLWCYAQIGQVRDAPKVTVVGEVWGDGWAKRRGRLVCLRASVRRDPRVPVYDRFFRTLFDIYSGIK